MTMPFKKTRKDALAAVILVTAGFTLSGAASEARDAGDLPLSELVASAAQAGGAGNTGDATSGATGGCYPAGLAAERIRSEIAEQRKASGDGKARDPDLQGGMDNGLSLLVKTEEALAAGRTILSLERLLAARALLEPHIFAGSHVESFKTVDEATCLSAAAENAKSIDPLRRGLKRASPRSLPFAARALRDDARVEAPIYEQTAQVWCDSGDYPGGVYYSANALALARNASYVATLPFDPPPPAPRLPDLAPILDRLDHDLAAAYRPPASQERHRDFIVASSAIKAARDILKAGSGEGALYQYLRARQYAWPITHPGAAPPVPGDLRAASAPLGARLKDASADHSLACLFWEKAGAAIEAAEKGENADDMLRAAEAILRDVVPEYFRLIEED